MNRTLLIAEMHLDFKCAAHHEWYVLGAFSLYAKTAYVSWQEASGMYLMGGEL